jgi:hypothetical protein
MTVREPSHAKEEERTELLDAHAALSQVLTALIHLDEILATGQTDELEQILTTRQRLLDELIRRDPPGIFVATAASHRTLLAAGHMEEAAELLATWEQTRGQFTQVTQAEAIARTALETARDALLAQVATHTRTQSLKRYGPEPQSVQPRFLDGLR